MYAYFLILNGWAICGSGAQGRWGISNTFNLFDKHGGGRNTSSVTRSVRSPASFPVLGEKGSPVASAGAKTGMGDAGAAEGAPSAPSLCVNVDEQLCHYIILTLFISPVFRVWPSICRGQRYRVSNESVWVVCFLIWLPLHPKPLVF